jgi:hypothetical protein
VNFLIQDGRRVVAIVRDATDDAVRGACNTWFLLCHSSLDEVVEAERLDSAIEEDDHVYYVRRRHVHGSDLMVQVY